MRAIKVPVDGPIEVVEVGTEWHQLAAAIGGPCQYIEEVRCRLSLDHGLVMIVDEDGVHDGQRRNHRALGLFPFQPIFGDVLVMQEGTEDFVDLEDPDKALQLVNEVTV